MKYKVGDKVLILDGRGLKGVPVWVDSMDCTIGRTGVITGCDGMKDVYRVKTAVSPVAWSYDESWLAPADSYKVTKDLPFATIGDFVGSRFCGASVTPKPKRLVRNGRAMVVFWDDGTKTIVKRAEDETDNNYAAFTAALAIKIFGSNSAVHRIVNKTEAQEKRKKQERKKREYDCKNCGYAETTTKCLEKSIAEHKRPPCWE